MSDAPLCFAVLGHPIGHSRSPAMHAAAFAALGEPHRYLAFDVPPEHLADALRGAAALGFGGLNLTVPHKQAAVVLVDALSPEAERIGAVNTVVFRDGKTTGHSTDGPGFLEGLAAMGPPPNRKAVVLGGGGAARSVVDAMIHDDHPWDVEWVSRTPDRLPNWARTRALGWGEIEEALAGAGLLVNATTVGMDQGPQTFPRPLPLEGLHDAALVSDLVYPRPPRGLWELAQARKLQHQDGLPMLLWQGVLAQQRWRGRPLPKLAVEAMQRALGG